MQRNPSQTMIKYSTSYPSPKPSITMESKISSLSSPKPKPNRDYSSSVDTSRPFSSVKEAVAIFGQRILTRNSPNEFLGTLKKLEAELEETKVELRMLKEKESETEMALATLNAELHKNMSKLAEVRIEDDRKAIVMKEEERRKEKKLFRMEESPSLAEVLSLGDERGYFGSKLVKKKKKKKPIVPLVGDLFSTKKEGRNPTSSIYAAPHFLY